VEYSPYIAHDDVYRPLKVTCEKFNIVISGFSTMAPLAVSKNGPVDPVLQDIAGKRGRSDTQILLQWAMQTLSGPVVL
jgi:diketogulonate reductase-like aldo/keto reductase